MRERWRELAKLAARFRGRPVAVAGDLVLDRYWRGAVQRVSREAPVPIVRLDETRLMPGCAANTVMNLVALGAEVRVVGAVGKDREGDALLDLMRRAGADCAGVVRAGSWITPTKTRVLAGGLHGPRQQLVRVDSGESNPYAPPVVRALRKALDRAVDGAQALVVSDYGYGLVEAVGAQRFAGRVPVSALDSRFALKRFRGLTTATPNEEEFADAAGPGSVADAAALERAGEALRAEMGLKALLVTRGSKGMCLLEAGRRPEHIPIVGTDQVVDVTGAGDTVISTYVLALCAGATFSQAAHLANLAGGIVVERQGPATTTPAELKARLAAWGGGVL
jgi:rfaE bifunctional protein kinase chain/domain